MTKGYLSKKTDARALVQGESTPALRHPSSVVSRENTLIWVEPSLFAFRTPVEFTAAIVVLVEPAKYPG